MSPSRLLTLTPVAVLAALLAAPAAHAGGGGTVQGSVKFLGKAPARKAIDRSSDKVCAATPAETEDVLVTGGKLRDVHVRIQSGTAGKHAAPRAPLVIEQTACAYRPRVAGAMAGQTVQIKNGDATMHNVHAYVDAESAFNKSQPKGAKPIEHKDLGAAGQVFTLKCDVHSWMRAFVPVTDHPYFAVTGDDGAFALKDVPPGTYTVEAWHPKLGLKKKQVTVQAGKPATVDFIFN